MIIISRDLVLAPAPAAFSADNPVVGWNNIITIANLAADTQETDNPASNLANPATHRFWRASDNSEQHLTVTIDQVDPVDYMAVARHNFGSASIPLSIEGQATGGGSWDELAGEAILPDDGPAIFRFEPQSLVGLRLRMQSAAAPPEAAVLYAGKLLVLERRIYVGHVPMPLGRRTDIVNGRSIGGNFLGRIVTGEGRETSVAIANMTPDWYRSYMDPFVDAAREIQFFFAWRPSTYPREVGYAWMTNDAQPSNQRSNGMMQIQLDMAGIA